MFEAYLTVTALVLASATLLAYARSGDVLHPLMFLGPLFFYGTVLDPWLVKGELFRFFPNPDEVNVVLLLDLLAVAALVLGVLHVQVRRSVAEVRLSRGLPPGRALTLKRVAIGLALWAFCAYAYGIVNAGGFVEAFSRVKGGGHAGSGYISEGVNLGLVAAVMVALSRYRRGWTLQTLGLLIVGLAPNLVQGTFGGRRGPLFLALSAAMLSWYLIRVRAPRLWAIWPALAATGLAVMFVASQRQFLYLGSGEQVQWEAFAQAFAPEDADEGNNFIYGAGFVLTSRHAGSYTWGRELAVNLLVRPVPRQLWPSKYEDVGATWVTSQFPGLGHVTPGDWLAAVGWLPFAGSSAISISDLFGEFSWGAILVFYLIGRGFAELNARRMTRGGMWELLYLEALMLSIYLATQSFSAFYHRYLILAVPTVIVWRKFLERRSRTAGRPVVKRYRNIVRRPALS